MKKVKITKDTGITHFSQGAVWEREGSNVWKSGNVHSGNHEWILFLVREGYAEEVQEEPNWRTRQISEAWGWAEFESIRTGVAHIVPRSLYEHIVEKARKDERQSIHARIHHLTWLATPDAERLSEALRVTGFCKEVHKLQEYLDGNK